LMAGDLYLNIHTTTNASGEIRGQVLKESNFFPDSLPLISSPASGATVDISGFAATTFDATWSSSSEPDGNLLVYYWQLSDTSDFSSMIINRNVGSSPAFSTDFADIDSLLANAGVNVGDTVRLYHRAIASDGSLCIEGTLDSVMLVRGVVFPTSIENLTEKNISVSPNPFSNTINLEMETDVPGDIRWSLIDLMGKEVQKGEFNLTTGKNKYELSIYDLPQGMYILTLGAGNQRILQKKLLKE
ncbi:MAG: T9SS type A sorting domain-containing protein, partial [Bacteroidetes bacterium]|nr:T9SS type A sorting domain-containing protein [Bacteroidota bacterium]